MITKSAPVLVAALLLTAGLWQVPGLTRISPAAADYSIAARPAALRPPSSAAETLATGVLSSPVSHVGLSSPQSVDAACAAACQSEDEHRRLIADDKLAQSKYYVAMGGGECPSPWNDPNSVCSADYMACESKCGLYDVDCRKPCRDALQPCCHAVEIANSRHYLEQCLRECPAAAGVPRGEAPDRHATWTVLLANLNTMMEELAPGIEALDLERFDDLRRDLAFMQVTAGLARNASKFAVVAGGAGRVWVILPGGKRVLLEGEPSSWWEPGAPHLGLLENAGLDEYDMMSMRNTLVQAANRNEFKAGTVYYFPPDSIQWWLVGSSEHSTIRGSINGGGDFI